MHTSLYVEVNRPAPLRESTEDVFMLRIEIQAARHEATLRCCGRIVLGVEAEILRCLARSRPESRVVLDLRDIVAIDAAGLGLLVELHGWAQDGDKLLELNNPSPCLRRLFILTNLHRVLKIAYSADFDSAKEQAGTAFARRVMTA